MEFDLIQGDIAEQRADALVCPTGTSLMMDTGAAAQALLHAGGEELGEAALEQGPIGLGEVAVTDAYQLDADYVVHAAAAHFGGEASADHLRSAVSNALAAADRHDCETLVTPAVGCGIAGFDVEEGVQIIASEVESFDAASLSSVSLIAYTSAEHDRMRAGLAEH
ncbi:MAG: macro domain-containing protein [Haloarculaceae archaeon]